MTQSHLARVIDRTALIENMLDQILSGFCRPAQTAQLFFGEVLLDSSVMPLGSKVKAVMALAQMLDIKLDPAAMHKVISLRNAFAHHATDSHMTFDVTDDPSAASISPKLYILSTSGKIRKVKHTEALEEFDLAFIEARNALLALSAQVASLVAQPRAG
ncbi:hypothetical protein [Variovorax sp. efr-133-TYG-130]|uniref:hypothetical protein n=1 Tax=Variovorax sp. efr-133-TYG-130 TaxID=3040327 RepID=UPI002556638A|nr:hypothetical protein [Variovorax sp. efr-133-TYG-130]